MTRQEPAVRVTVMCNTCYALIDPEHARLHGEWHHALTEALAVADPEDKTP